MQGDLLSLKYENPLNVNSQVLFSCQSGFCQIQSHGFVFICQGCLRFNIKMLKG